MFKKILKNKKLLFVIFLFFAFFTILNIYTSVKVDAQTSGSCPGGWHPTCGVSRCTTWINCNPGQFFCYDPGPCGCGSCPDEPVPPAPPGTPPPPPGCGTLRGCSWQDWFGETRCVRSDFCTSYLCDDIECCERVIPENPSGPTPANNSLVSSSSVALNWTNNGFGNGCPSVNRMQLQFSSNCTGTWVTLVDWTAPSLFIKPVNVSNLPTGTAHCWRVNKSNRAGTADDRIGPTWRFTVAPPPGRTFNTLAANACGQNYSGMSTSTGAANPLDISFSYTGSAGTWEEVFLVIATATGASSSSEPLVTDPQMRTRTNNNNNNIMIRLAVGTNAIRIVGHDTGNWGAAITPVGGNVAHHSGKFDVLGIGSTTRATLSGNTVNASFRVRFNNSYFNGRVNIYTTAIQRLASGSFLGAHSSVPDEIDHSLAQGWGVDPVAPAVSLTNPQIFTTGTDAGNFRVTWSFSDASGAAANPMEVFSYITRDRTGVRLQDRTATLPQTEIALQPDSYGYASASNGLVNASTSAALRVRMYRDISDGTPLPLDARYTFKLTGRDFGCNVANATVSTAPISSTQSWMINTNGNTSANGGVNGMTIPSISNYTQPPYITTPGNPFFSTYDVISGTTGLPSPFDSISQYRKYITGYTNTAVRPPADSGFTSWYQYIRHLITQNQRPIFAVNLPSTIGGPISSVFNPNNPSIIRTYIDHPTNLTVSSGATCDKDTIIFVNGNLTINPDFTNTTADRRCVFVVSGNITINAGTRKTPATTTLASATAANYDEVHAYLIADGNITIPEDNLGATVKWDGIYINGGLVTAGNISIARDLNTTANSTQPAMIVNYDPRFRIIFLNDLANRRYSVREVGL